MNKRWFSVAGACVLTLATAGIVFGQDTTTTTTTTTVQQAVPNGDGTFSIVEYPVGKQVVVNLTPTTLIPGATGTATILRSADGTTVKVDLTGLTGDASNYNLYAVDPNGNVTLLGPVPVNNGIATYSTTTPLNKFMLFVSPDPNLTTYGADTRVALRSAVPDGMAVIPVRTRNSGGSVPSRVGDRVSAVTQPTAAYNVPMLGIPNFKRGKETHMRINFSGDLAGSHANAFILPRQDGPTQIKVRFHDLKRSMPNTRVVVWAVSPDNHYVKIGQIINPGDRNETEIKGETALRDFGLFITTEAEEATAPTTPVIGTFTVMP